MQIDCPSCGAAYQVPEAVLAARRTVRCVRCGKDWIPGGAAAQLDTGAEAAPEFPALQEAAAAGIEGSPPPRHDATLAEAPALPSEASGEPGSPPEALAAASPKAPPSARIAVICAWAASVALFAALGASAIAWRAPVMHAWPASARLYAAIGKS